MPPATDIRVLVVDDYAEMRALILLAFKMAGGFEVVAEANNAEEAIRQAERVRPEAVVLDVRLPGRSGPAAMPEIVRAAGGRCSVVLLTALSEDNQMLAGARAGGAPIHSKADLPRLPEVLRSLVESNRRPA
jgi:DNA-binding NarL/FixJ family response regulator